MSAFVFKMHHLGRARACGSLPLAHTRAQRRRLGPVGESLHHQPQKPQIWGAGCSGTCLHSLRLLQGTGKLMHR